MVLRALCAAGSRARLRPPRAVSSAHCSHLNKGSLSSDSEHQRTTAQSAVEIAQQRLGGGRPEFSSSQPRYCSLPVGPDHSAAWLPVGAANRGHSHAQRRAQGTRPRPGAMMPLLITLSVRRAQPGHGEGEGSAVFFVKVGAQHTVQALRDTLCRMLGLTPNAGLPLVFNGALLDPAVRPAEVSHQTLASMHWLSRFGPAGSLSNQAQGGAVSVCSGSGPGHVRETVSGDRRPNQKSFPFCPCEPTLADPPLRTRPLGPAFANPPSRTRPHEPALANSPSRASRAPRPASPGSARGPP
ncbi:hypothetical protein T492DRAFT_95799 [Pavlovales sp. CCMP2436]|nr:hypothetical protein T492DRAFT_95799 [Pavlovales sp. CCMP2436]